VAGGGHRGRDGPRGDHGRAPSPPIGADCRRPGGWKMRDGGGASVWTEWVDCSGSCPSARLGLFMQELSDNTDVNCLYYTTTAAESSELHLNFYLEDRSPLTPIMLHMSLRTDIIGANFSFLENRCTFSSPMNMLCHVGIRKTLIIFVELARKCTIV
jgi:hypothetical protein